VESKILLINPLLEALPLAFVVVIFCITVGCDVDVVGLAFGDDVDVGFGVTVGAGVVGNGVDEGVGFSVGANDGISVGFGVGTGIVGAFVGTDIGWIVGDDVGGDVGRQFPKYHLESVRLVDA